MEFGRSLAWDLSPLGAYGPGSGLSSVLFFFFFSSIRDSDAQLEFCRDMSGLGTILTQLLLMEILFLLLFG